MTSGFLKLISTYGSVSKARSKSPTYNVGHLWDGWKLELSDDGKLTLFIDYGKGSVMRIRGLVRLYRNKSVVSAIFNGVNPDKADVILLNPELEIK